VLKGSNNKLDNNSESHIIAGDIHYLNNLFESQCSEYQIAYDLAQDDAMREKASKRLVTSFKYLRRHKQLREHLTNHQLF
jgi:hypothetical protein